MTVDLDAPQFGEQAWHAFTADPTIRDQSHAHRDRIVTAVADHLPKLDWTAARFLEVGAYRHYTGHLLAAERGCESVLTDLSAAALRDGRRQAERDGVPATATLVPADFHELPVSTDSVDIVFVAASVHHTRSPEVVLREMLRILKPGGILILHNEPCARLCCFHAFASNRPDSLTPYELRLRDAGLLPTISSPFGGARPEQLFGMVENDRIPLSLYLDTFAAAGDVVERKLSMHSLVGSFEEGILALAADHPAVATQVAGRLRAAVAFAREGMGDTERLLGYRMPTECDIHAMAASIARVLSQPQAFDTRDDWLADLFGSALSAVVRKHEGAKRSVPLFAVPMTPTVDGMTTAVGAGSDSLTAPLLPDLPTCDDGAALEPWYPARDWQWMRTDDGVRTMANLGAVARVDIAPHAQRTLLLVRYFAVVGNVRPYRVRLWASGQMLAEQLIVLQESRLMRVLVPPNCAELVFEIAADDDADMDYTWRIRVGVLQQFRAS